MRSSVAPALLLAALYPAVTLCAIGCDEKMGVEKRAADIAASASAEKARAAASAMEPDPAEIKYRERKTALEATIKAYKADQGRILSGDTSVKPGLLRPYHASGAEADKAVKELEAKLKKESADGVRLRKVVEPLEIRLAGNMEEAEVEIIEERASKNTSACLLYVESWKYAADKWVLAELQSVRKVDCS